MRSGDKFEVDVQVRANVAGWERWTVERWETGKVRFRSFHGNYLSTKQGGKDAPLALQFNGEQDVNFADTLWTLEAPNWHNRHV